MNDDMITGSCQKLLGVITKEYLIFSPFCKASLQMFRPSSVSAWGAVRTVPKRTTPLARQQHLWRPRPSVPLFVRCLELLPFQCSRRGDYSVGHSECLTWYLKGEILVAFLTVRPTAQRQQINGTVGRHGRHLSKHPKREIGTDRQQQKCGATAKQANYRGIVGTENAPR